MTERELAERYQARTRRKDRSACLPAELLVRASGEEASAAERDAVVDHLRACSDCAEEFRDLRSVEPWALRAAGGAPVRPAWRRRAVWTSILAAAAAVAVALSVSLLRTPPEPDLEETTRSGVEPPRVELLEPLGRLDSPPARLAWRPMTGAQEYQVRVFTEDGMLFWTSGVIQETSLEAARLPAFRPGRYLWHVTALRAGAPIARSRPGSFSLPP